MKGTDTPSYSTSEACAYGAFLPRRSRCFEQCSGSLVLPHNTGGLLWHTTEQRACVLWLQTGRLPQ